MKIFLRINTFRLKKDSDYMIESLYSSFKAVLEMTWPMLFISMVLLVSVRASYLLKHKSEFVFYKEVLLLFFALYILCLPIRLKFTLIKFFPK